MPRVPAPREEGQGHRGGVRGKGADVVGQALGAVDHVANLARLRVIPEFLVEPPVKERGQEGAHVGAPVCIPMGTGISPDNGESDRHAFAGARVVVVGVAHAEVLLGVSGDPDGHLPVEEFVGRMDFHPAGNGQRPGGIDREGEGAGLAAVIRNCRKDVEFSILFPYSAAAILPPLRVDRAVGEVVEEADRVRAPGEKRGSGAPPGVISR